MLLVCDINYYESLRLILQIKRLDYIVGINECLNLWTNDDKFAKGSTNTVVKNIINENNFNLKKDTETFFSYKYRQYALIRIK